jgi:hypothetical protein
VKRIGLLAAVEAQAAQFDEGRLTAAELHSWLHGLHTDHPESVRHLAEALDSDDAKDRLGANGWLALRGILDDLLAPPTPHAREASVPASVDEIDEIGELAGEATMLTGESAPPGHDARSGDAVTTSEEGTAPARAAPPPPLPPLQDQRPAPPWETALSDAPVAPARRPILARHHGTRMAAVGVALLLVVSVGGASAVIALALSPDLHHRVSIAAPAWLPEWMPHWAEDNQPAAEPPASAVAVLMTIRGQETVPLPLPLPSPLSVPAPGPDSVTETAPAPTSELPLASGPEAAPETQSSREVAPAEARAAQEVEERAPPDQLPQIPTSVPTRYSLVSSQLRVPGTQPAILLPVIREGALDSQTRLEFEILPGSARPDEDYVPASGSSVRFAVGEERALIIVPLFRGGATRGERDLRVRLLVDDPAMAGDVMDVRIILAGSD